MAPYAIADIRDVLEQGKVVCRELLPNQGKALLWMYIYWAEKALEQYLVSIYLDIPAAQSKAAGRGWRMRENCPALDFLRPPTLLTIGLRVQAHSSQKTFMGPELSTIKMREKLADEGMQRLLSVEATSDESEPTKHDLAIVSDERGPFEYHLRLWHDVQDALLGIHSFTVSFDPLRFLLSKKRRESVVTLSLSHFAAAYGNPKCPRVWI